MARTFRMPTWLTIMTIIAVAVAAAAGGIYLGSRLAPGESRDAQVVKSVTKQEQVILLSAGIVGVKEAQADTKFLGLFDIAGNERAMFVKYEFEAKFGIDGGDVSIEPMGEDHYRITIPKFVSLGYDAPKFSSPIEANGALSWSTPEIDKLKVAQESLAGDSVDQYLKTYRPALEAQAKTFYSNIIMSINPGATLDFVFTA